MANSKPAGTALLYFARSAGAESLAKVFTHRGKKENTGIAARLFDRAEELAYSSGLPVFHLSEVEQVGTDFGERFSNALADVFSLGYDKIVAIGSDCPGLRRSDLTTAIRSLEAGASVLGPTRKGGTYLLGLHRDDFDPEKFAGLDWQERSLFHDLRNYLKGRPVRLLSKRADVNDVKQLKLVAGLLGRSNIVRQILAFLSECALVIRERRKFLLPADFNGLRPVCRPPPVHA